MALLREFPTFVTRQHILWQEKTLRISGKGSPHGKKTKKRVVPLSRRIQTLPEHYFALHEKWFVGTRQVQKIVKKISNKAQIRRNRSEPPLHLRAGLV